MKVHSLLLTLTACVALCSAKDPRCPEVNDPLVAIHYPHPTDCSKFLTCNWGELVEQQCPDGQLWNDAKKYCDYPENSDCGAATAEPDTTITESTDGTTPPEPTDGTTPPEPTDGTTSAEPAAKCPQEEDPDHTVFLPHVDCSKFYMCTWNGVAVEKDCPAGLHWNQQQSHCDYPHQAGCVSGNAFVRNVKQYGRRALR